MSKYQLVNKTKNLNKFKIVIVADSNDADYVTTTHYCTKKVFDEYIIDALIDLKTNYSGRHQLPNYPNEWDLSIPYNGWDGPCHTLTRLEVEFIDESGRTWEVIF